ncbi:MAG: alpha/beta fold hydrolase [Saprospiraceae bacterium]|nr:alpha/beta fold hydrolase [Lewinella sp.]
MNKILKKMAYTLLAIVASVFIIGLILAFFPTGSKLTPESISPEEAATLRDSYDGPHHLVTTSDWQTLFLRRWDTDSIETAKAGTAILILHGVTAHSGAYNRAGELLSAGGYPTFGLDYRGHGLSDGNRADYPDRARWVGDMAESVAYIKKLGYEKVIILGHSLGVAATIYVTQAIPDEIAGNKKEFLVLENTYHAKFPDKSWTIIVNWLDDNF